MSDSPYKYYVCGDFNGDGNSDLINYGNECYEGSSSATQWRIYSTINTNFDAGLVNTISNGLNQIVKINYLPLCFSKVAANKDFYKSKDDYKYPFRYARRRIEMRLENNYARWS
jgi:hypothetical protein